MSAIDRIVIAGGGLAAVRTAQALRSLSYDGQLVIVSEEVHRPYDRPPLSKRLLLDAGPPEPEELLDEASSATLGIDLLLGHRVVGLGPVERELHLDGPRDRLTFDRLVVATGARPRRLAAVASVPSAQFLRTQEDAALLANHFAVGADLVIIGGGFVGLEVAAAATARGSAVTVVEAAALPLVGPLGAVLATWLRDHHVARGVQFKCGTTVTSAGAGDGGARLTLSDGGSLTADRVLVGVGVARDLGWLSRAGLETHVGLVIDHDGRTSHPHVFAAGDVTCRHDHGGCRPGGHWTAAREGARRTARAVLGQKSAEPSFDDGFFWSTQGDLRLQSVGAPSSESSLEIVSGDLDSAKFVAQWTEPHGGAVVGVVGCNSPRDFLDRRRVLRQPEVP